MDQREEAGAGLSIAGQHTRTAGLFQPGRRRQSPRHPRFDESRRRRGGSADLAAIEAEIKKLDSEIDQRVYDLYGLTDKERAIVEDAAK